MNRLKDKVCIITGAAQGIGEGIARLFFAEGAKIVIVDKQKRKALSVAESFVAENKVIAIRADITIGTEVNQMVEQVLNHFGRIDTLVNNAGKNFFLDPLKITPIQWDKCLQTDLTGAWICSKAVLPQMLKQGTGNIINIASIHSHRVLKGCFPYPVAKHALLGLTRALAIEYADKNIRVNAIAPGLIETPLAEKWFNTFDNPELIKREEIAQIPQKRMGKVTEVAYTALFLASDEARFINAECITIDGARTATC